MAKGKKKAGKKAKKAVANGAAKPKKAKEKKPAKEAAPKPEKKEAKTSPELEELRKVADNGKAEFEKAKAEADALRQKAAELEAKAKAAYREAVAPYRETCRKAGVECEYASSRGTSVSERLRFLAEKTDEGIRLMVKDQPETEEVIPFDVLKKSVNKAAAAYAEKHIGPKEIVGNKQGTISNKLRALMTAK